MVEFPAWTVYAISPLHSTRGDEQGRGWGSGRVEGVDYLKCVLIALEENVLSYFACPNRREWARVTQRRDGGYAYDIG